MAIINNNNVSNVKFLRNGSVYESHELAYNALTGFTLTDEQDGTAILARYTATDGNVKTLVGWVYKNGATSYVTIQDVEGASADIEELREEINAKLGEGVSSGAGETVSDQLAALSGSTTATSGETSVAGAKAYTNDKIDELKDSLEYTGVTTGDGVVIVNVTEADGIISGKTAEVGGLKLTDYTKGSDSGAVATTDSINGAFSKVENQIDAVNDKINNLDYTDTAVTKQFVAAVDETDGVISVTRGEIESSGKTIVLTADGNDVNFEVNIDGASIVQDPTSKKIKVADSALTQYFGDEKTIHAEVDAATNKKTFNTLLQISATTPSETNVKEQYNLVNASGETIGATIKIYKDSSVAEIYVGTNYDSVNTTTGVVDKKQIGDVVDEHTIVAEDFQYLNYVYQKSDGTYEMTKINLTSFLIEPEFKSGVTISNGVVIGVVDPTSEKDSQDTPVDFLTVGADGFKISGIKAEIDRKLNAIVEDLDATVSNSGTSGHVGVEVVEEDGKLTAITVSENDIASQAKLDELSAKTITELTSANNSIAISDGTVADGGTMSFDIITDASKIKMSGFTADASGFTAITEDSTVTEAVKAIEATFLDNEETTAAALNDLNARINTVSGDVETISGKVDTIEEKYISGVSVNGTAVTVANHVAPISISAATSATTASTSNAIVVDTDANGNITLGLNYIDCGTY